MKLATPTLLFATALALASPALAAPAYTLSRSIPLGSPDRWDYVVFSPETGDVYIAHGDTVSVVDPDAGKVVGTVSGIPGGTHGTAISVATGQGFTDDGQRGLAVAYDLKTLKVAKTIPADKDADGIAADKATGHIFVVEGDPAKMTVIDPKTDAAVATVDLGEKPEYVAADGAGSVFVAGTANSDLIKVDARTNKVVAHWPTPACKNPHGLALDVAAHRAFMSCVNSAMMVVDTTTGKVVAQLAIGRGSDTAAFDPVRKRAFSSDGVDGVVSVYQQVSPDKYTALEAVKTAVGGKTMSVDPKTGRLFVAAADLDPPAQEGGRPTPRPGTLRLMILEPAGK